MEHEKLLAKLEKRMGKTEVSEINDPPLLTDAVNNNNELENDSKNLYEDWGDTKTSNNDENTIIFIIIGVIAVIIIGVIIKLKKN